MGTKTFAKRSYLAAGIAAVSLSLALPALGQSARGEFSAQRFLPAPGGHNFITVEGARTKGRFAYQLGAYTHYGSNPFLIETCVAAADCSQAASRSEIRVLRDLITVDLLGAVVIVPRVQVGFRVPYSYASGDGLQSEPGSPTIGQPAWGGVKTQWFGDPMLELKYRAIGLPESRWVLGVSVFGTAPVGKSSASEGYIGDPSATFGGRLIGDLLLFQRLRIAANLGGVARKDGRVAQTVLGSEFRYGVAASYQLTPLLFAVGEGFGATNFGTSGGTNAMELAGALRFLSFSQHFALTAGAGAGVIAGVGSPGYRVFLGISYSNESGDRDGDGIADDRDLCPVFAEDFDGFQDADGCPDRDDDGDNVADSLDRCPNQPETLNGMLDEDGCPDETPDRDKDGVADGEDKCPDEGGPTIVLRKGPLYGCPDRDKDGIPDKLDRCPDEKEDTDGFMDEDGCFDADNDGDGVPDERDQCVDEPEIVNGLRDDDGCPDGPADRDGDGIADGEDICPDQPESYNGQADDDGCAEPSGPYVVLEPSRIVLKEPIGFEPNGAAFAGKRTLRVLDAVVSILKHHPEVWQVQVVAFGPGKASDLAQRRAEAVVEHLLAKGIEAKRVERPASNGPAADAVAGDGQVEFRITRLLKWASAPSRPAPGQGAAPPPRAMPKPQPVDMGEL